MYMIRITTKEQITIKELRLNIKRLKNGKTSGLDSTKAGIIKYIEGERILLLHKIKIPNSVYTPTIVFRCET